MTVEKIVTHTVVLNLSEKPETLLAQSENIATKLTNNADVPTPLPSVASIVALNATLKTAITDARKKTAGTKAIRVAAEKAVKDALTLVKASVQAAVNAASDRALVIAEGCGMALKTTTLRVKPDFKVSQPKGYVSGMLLAERKSIGPRTSSEWAWSQDGGKTFTALPGTIDCSTKIPGLPVGALVVVRHRYLTKKGYLDWLQSTPITVG